MNLKNTGTRLNRSERVKKWAGKRDKLASDLAKVEAQIKEANRKEQSIRMSKVSKIVEEVLGHRLLSSDDEMLMSTIKETLRKMVDSLPCQ